MYSMKKLKSGAVVDDQGRMRLHGAFTGGFSAGYFNTVGTVEGFKPATFVSSRNARADILSRSAKDYMEESDESSDEEDKALNELAANSGIEGFTEETIEGSQRLKRPKVLSEDQDTEYSLIKQSKPSNRKRKEEHRDVYKVDDIHSKGVNPNQIFHKDSSTHYNTKLTTIHDYSYEEGADNVYENDREGEHRRFGRTVLDTDDADDIPSNKRFKESVLSKINENIDNWLDSNELLTELNSNKKIEPIKDENDHISKEPQFIVPKVAASSDETINEGKVDSIFDLIKPKDKLKLQSILKKSKNEPPATEDSTHRDNSNEYQAQPVNKPTAVTERPMLLSKYQSSLATFSVLNESFKNRFTSAAVTVFNESVPKEGIATAADFAAERQKQENENASADFLSNISSSSVVKTAEPAPTRFRVTRSTSTWAPVPLLCKRMNIKTPEISTMQPIKADADKTTVRIESMLGLIQKTEDTSYSIIQTETDKKYALQKEKSSTATSSLPSVAVVNSSSTSQGKLSRHEKKALYEANKLKKLAEESKPSIELTNEAIKESEEDDSPIEINIDYGRGSQPESLDKVLSTSNTTIEAPKPAELFPTFKSRSQRQAAGDTIDDKKLSFSSSSKILNKKVEDDSDSEQPVEKKQEAVKDEVEDEDEDELLRTSKRRRMVSGSSGSRKKMILPSDIASHATTEAPLVVNQTESTKIVSEPVVDVTSSANDEAADNFLNLIQNETKVERSDPAEPEMSEIERLILNHNNNIKKFREMSDSSKVKPVLAPVVSQPPAPITRVQPVKAIEVEAKKPNPYSFSSTMNRLNVELKDSNHNNKSDKHKKEHKHHKDSKKDKKVKKDKKKHKKEDKKSHKTDKKSKEHKHDDVVIQDTIDDGFSSSTCSSDND